MNMNFVLAEITNHVQSIFIMLLVLGHYHTVKHKLWCMYISLICNTSIAVHFDLTNAKFLGIDGTFQLEFIFAAFSFP